MNTSKHTLIALLAAALAPAALHAQDPAVAAAAGAQWDGYAEINYASRHMFRGVQQSKDAMQAAVGWNPVGNGLYAGAWHNQPVRNTGNELDLFGGYRHAIRAVSLDAGLTAYLYPKADDDDGETTSSYEFALGASYKACPRLTVAGRAFYDFRLETRTVELGLSSQLPLKLGSRREVTLEFSAHAGHSLTENGLPNVPGLRLRDDWVYAGAAVSATTRLTKAIHLTGSVHYSHAHGQRGGDDVTGKVWGRLGIGTRW